MFMSELTFEARFAFMNKLSAEHLANAWYQLRRSATEWLNKSGSNEELGVIIDGLVCCLWIMQNREVSLSMRGHAGSLDWDVEITRVIIDGLCEIYQTK